MRNTFLAIGASLILALAALLFMQQFRPTNTAVRVGLIPGLSGGIPTETFLTEWIDN